MASPIGFEPTAPGLGILCSILLSYGDTALFLHGFPPPKKPVPLMSVWLGVTWRLGLAIILPIQGAHFGGDNAGFKSRNIVVMLTSAIRHRHVRPPLVPG